MLRHKIRFHILWLVLALTASIATGCRGLATSSDPPSNGPLPPTQTAVKRVVVIVLQNRSFDHLFGKYSVSGQSVEGIREGVPGFTQTDGTSPFRQTAVELAVLPHSRQDYIAAWNGGKMDKYAVTNGRDSMGYYTDETPGVDRLWALVRGYALADNYFASIMSDAPTNQLHLVAASDNNFPYGVQPAYGPCNKPDPASQPYTFRNVADQMNDKGISWSWYAEVYGQCDSGYKPVQNPLQFFTSTYNSPRIRDMQEFFIGLDDGTLPAVSFVSPADVKGGNPGAGSITTSLNWLDNTIQRIKGSPLWDTVAIVVVWDESGGFWDHVPPPQINAEGLGARVPMLVISPFSKAGYVSHVRMDHVSILKWIQMNWSLGTLNAREAQSEDISDMFQF